MCSDDDETQIDHEERTDNDETHEIDPIPEGMSILNVVHDVHPTLETDDLHRIDGARQTKDRSVMEDAYLEDAHPGQTDVVEADRTGEGILVGDVAESVVLIPIDASVDGLMGILGQLAAECVEIEFTC